MRLLPRATLHSDSEHYYPAVTDFDLNSLRSTDLGSTFLFFALVLSRSFAKPLVALF